MKLEKVCVTVRMVETERPGEPVLASESHAITLPATQTASAYLKTAAYEQLYFDTALPTKPGLNLDAAIANYFAKPGTSTASAIFCPR